MIRRVIRVPVLGCWVGLGRREVKLKIEINSLQPWLSVMSGFSFLNKSYTSIHFPEPEEPTEDDCCHNDCENCVFDVYQKALEYWKKKRADVDIRLRYDLLSLTKFKPFLLVSVSPLTHNTNLYRFKPEGDSSGSLPYRAGQYLSLRLDLVSKTDDNDVDSVEKHTIRDFTLTSLPGEAQDCSVEMIIKLYDKSSNSNWIRSLQLGDRTYWRGPYGDFHYVPNKYSNIIMLCIGTGVAPMYPLVKQIVNNDQDVTKVAMLYGSRLASDIIFRKQLHDLASYWNFNYTYFLSQEKEMKDKNHFESFVNSRISLGAVEQAVGNKADYLILICGSQSFVDDLKGILNQLQIPSDKIYVF